jgi:hypothetical protein
LTHCASVALPIAALTKKFEGSTNKVNLKVTVRISIEDVDKELISNGHCVIRWEGKPLER